jgi:hypothetical protein
MFNWLVGTCAMYSGSIGKGWERAIALTDETLASSPSDYDRARALLTKSLLQARRGEDLDQLVAVCAAAAEGIQDGQITGGLDYVRSEVALAQGRLAEAHTASVRALDDWKDSAPFVLQRALHAAAISRDMADAQQVKRILDAYPSGTPTAVAARAWAAAVVDGIEGRQQESLSGLRNAFETFRAIGLGFDAAIVVVSALRLWPGEAEVAGWVPQARQIFEGVGARPYLEMLDQALSAAPASAKQARQAPVTERTTA